MVRAAASHDNAGLHVDSIRHLARVIESFESGAHAPLDPPRLRRAFRTTKILSSLLDTRTPDEGKLNSARNHLLDELLRDTRERRPEVSAGSATHSCDDLSIAYATDAAKELRSARTAAFSAGVSLLLSIAVAFWASRLANDAPAGRTLEVLLFPALVSISITILIVFLLRQIHLGQRNAREYRRLSRGLSGLSGYLESLPEPARFLIRATLTPSLFPRLLDDDDPMRQVAWPSERTVLTAIYGYGEEQPEPSPANAGDSHVASS